MLLIVGAVAALSQVAANGLPLRRGERPADESVELVVQEVARCANGQAVLVLREKTGDRRLPMPVGPAEAAALERRLHGEKSERPHLQELTASSIQALGGQVTRASIETIGTDKVFLGHLTVRGGSGSVELASRAADSVVLAMEAGAPIVVSRRLLDQSGVTPGELGRSYGAAKARSSRTAPPAPVYRI